MAFLTDTMKGQIAVGTSCRKGKLGQKEKKYLPQGSSAALGQAQKGCEVSILGDAPAMT